MFMWMWFHYRWWKRRFFAVQDAANNKSPISWIEPTNNEFQSNYWSNRIECEFDEATAMAPANQFHLIFSLLFKLSSSTIFLWKKKKLAEIFIEIGCICDGRSKNMPLNCKLSCEIWKWERRKLSALEKCALLFSSQKDFFLLAILFDLSIVKNLNGFRQK